MRNSLREIRKSKGMTQICLAQKAEINRTVIAKFETGATKQLSTKNLAKIARALDCSMEDILKGDADNGKIAECG